MTDREKLRSELKSAIRSKDLNQVTALIDKSCKLISREEFDKLLDDVLINLSWEDHQWWMSQLPDNVQSEMSDRATNVVFSMLGEAGFQFGSDFSVGPEGGFMISPEAREFILSQVPEEERESFNQHFITITQDPYQLIEERLGVPFFENLKNIAAARVRDLDDATAISYIATVVEGIMKRHPNLDDFRPWFLSSVLDNDRLNRLIAAEPTDCGDTSFFLGDIVSAAGASGEVKQEGDQQLVSTSGLKLLAQVWDSEAYSLHDLIAAFDQKS